MDGLVIVDTDRVQAALSKYVTMKSQYEGIRFKAIESAIEACEPTRWQKLFRTSKTGAFFAKFTNTWGFCYIPVDSYLLEHGFIEEEDLNKYSLTQAYNNIYWSVEALASIRSDKIFLSSKQADFVSTFSDE